MITQGKAHIVLGMEPLETVRILRRYGNPEVTCITNTHPIFPMGAILSEENRYPGRNSLEETIRGLSKIAWFIDAAAIASELGSPIVVNIVMMGALIGARQLTLDKDDRGRDQEKLPPPSGGPQPASPQEGD